MQRTAHHTPERSPWAMRIIALVVILFGLFWLWQQREIARSSEAALSAQPPAPTSSHQQSSPSLSDLEASAVNISIPTFETLF